MPEFEALEEIANISSARDASHLLFMVVAFARRRWWRTSHAYLHERAASPPPPVKTLEAAVVLRGLQRAKRLIYVSVEP
jgi:hypothetical protein